MERLKIAAFTALLILMTACNDKTEKKPSSQDEHVSGIKEETNTTSPIPVEKGLCQGGTEMNLSDGYRRTRLCLHLPFISVRDNDDDLIAVLFYDDRRPFSLAARDVLKQIKIPYFGVAVDLGDQKTKMNDGMFYLVEDQRKAFVKAVAHYYGFNKAFPVPFTLICHTKKGCRGYQGVIPLEMLRHEFETYMIEDKE